MNVSYEGIGQWAATFACDGVSAGQVVKVRAAEQLPNARTMTALRVWCCPWPETAKPALWLWGAW